MTVTVKLGDLVQSQEALVAIGAVKNLPQSTVFRLGRAIRKAKDELRQWGEQRREIMKATGKVSPHPQITGELWIDPKSVSMEESEALDVKMRELNDTEVTLECLPMKLSEIGEKAMEQIQPAWMSDLFWLFTEEA